MDSIINDYFDLPNGMAKFVIGPKGANIKRIKYECQLQMCWVNNKDEFDFVHLRGFKDNVEKAKDMISMIVATRLSDLSRSMGFKPLFGLFIVRIPTAQYMEDQDIWFKLTEVTPQVQRKIAMSDGLRSIPCYATSSKASIAPPPPLLKEITHSKKTIIGYDRDVLKSYTDLVFEMLANKHLTPPNTISFSASVGCGFIQPRFKPSLDQLLTAEKFSALLQQSHHQYCSTLVGQEHLTKAQTWCEDNNYIKDTNFHPASLTVSAVHLEMKKKCSWVIPLELQKSDGDCEWWLKPRLSTEDDLEKYTLACERHRLGLINLLSKNEYDLGYRVEFLKTFMQDRLIFEVGAIDFHVLRAFDNRDADGYFKLPVSHCFQIDSLFYSKINRWVHPNTQMVVDLKESVRFIPSINAKAQKTCGIQVTTKSLIEKGIAFDKSEFSDEVVAVVESCGKMIDYINTSTI